MTEKKYDTLILGGGPAGLTAAIYNSRANLDSLVIAGQPAGGQLMWTTDVENYPGFPDGILGPDLVNKFRSQAERFGAEIVDENVIEISGSVEEGFTVKTDSENTYRGKVVLVATGASAKWLNLENEQKLRGRGVSACATCDGFFFKDKVVAVVGGGDAAMEESTFLTKFAKKIYVLVRGSKEEMRASKIMQKRAFSSDKIEFKFHTEVVDVLGENKVEGLKVVTNTTGEEYEMPEVEGLFIAIGHKPNTDFLEGFVELGKMGYLAVENDTLTSREGVFAAGDVSDYKYRQAVTASGLGCMAAIDAERYLSEHFGIEAEEKPY